MTKDAIVSAREYLLLYHPFYAYLALRFEYKEDKNIKAFAVDNTTIYYNPKNIDLFSIKEIAGNIAHCLTHVMFFHPLRQGGKDEKIWDMACDYAINPILVDSGMPMPQYFLHKDEFLGLSAEQIYKIIKEDENFIENNFPTKYLEPGEIGISPWEIGEVKHPEDEFSVKEEEDRIVQIITETAMQAQGIGELPNSIQEYVEQLKNPKQDWREVLQHFIAEVAQNDYNWNRPNKSYMQRSLYLPSLNNLELGGIGFAIDVSGSVDKELLAKFLSEVKEASSLFKDDIYVLQCDTKVTKAEYVSEEDIESIEIEGRGGTKFQPVFDHIENEGIELKALLYFTDGDCDQILIEPDYPVIWVVYNNPYFIAQFGETVMLED